MKIGYLVHETYMDCGMCDCVWGGTCQFNIHTGFVLEEVEIPEESPLLFVAKIADEIGIPIYFNGDRSININSLHGCARNVPWAGYYQERNFVSGRCIVSNRGTLLFSRDEWLTEISTRVVTEEFVLNDEFGVRRYLSENFK